MSLGPNMKLPESISAACQPLFEALPIDRAMSHLTGNYPSHTDLVNTILKDPALAGRPELAAGIWLYVDDLDRSHTVSQSIDGVTGAFWHGIMHRREGDFSNSHYWMRHAAQHPLIVSGPRLNPDDLIDAVSHRTAVDEELAQRQREEWATLFEWCANQT